MQNFIFKLMIYGLISMDNGWSGKNAGWYWYQFWGSGSNLPISQKYTKMVYGLV